VNPKYVQWSALEQQVLGFLLTSMTKDVMAQVASCSTPKEAWTLLEQTYASCSKARVVNTRMALATTQKGSMTISEYIAKMKSLADEMASAGKALEDEELVSYIMVRLDFDYNPIISTMVARVEPILVSELYAQLLSFETRWELTQGGQQASVNAARRGHGGGPGPNNRRRGRGHGGGHGRGFSNGQGGFTGGAPVGKRGDMTPCQVCGKVGHLALDCWHRFDESYTSEVNRSASAATNNYGIDTNWYTDSAATDHITGKLDKLTTRENYNRVDKIVVANGTGMDIHNVGHAVIQTPTRDLHLNNVLHVPSVSKNLISVHQFSTDNNASLEYFPNCFLIKDLDTRKVLFRGQCRDGLYSIPRSGRQIYGAFKPSFQVWHNRLGHPSFHIVDKVVKNNSLMCSSKLESPHVCDSCQQAKSHQLLYPVSTSVSSKPLELVFSDVWGPAPNSYRRKNYHVSFIDDFSKLTWVYHLCFKSEVFQKFTKFQTMI
jgi:hypothetical protein